ncbi:MAG TPA: hypothetical protein VGO03_09860 [Acidimicrobiia bacterium]|jgi:hypothetical protein
MVQTIGPNGREGEWRGDASRLQGADLPDLDGVLYRLGRLQRVLVDVKAQVHDLRTYASTAHADDAAPTDAVGGDLRRRMDRVEDALGSMRDDFDLVRDAVDALVERNDDAGAQVIALRGHTLPAGA